MEMKIKGSLVKNLRQGRAWSQQHLAEISGTSLRTIQRIEKTGQASPESTKALAAVFDVKVNELIEAASPKREIQRYQRLFVGIPVVAGLLASLAFLVTTATAAPVMLEVSFSDGVRQLADVQLLTEPGEAAEVILDNGWKVSLVPTITPEGQVRIAAEVYEPTDTELLSLVSSPIFIAEYHKVAGVRYEGDGGVILSFDVTPK